MHPTVKGSLMKKLCFPVLLCSLSYLSFSQKTYQFADPHERFNEAKEYYQKGLYGLAYPIFKELQQSLKETDKLNNPIVAQELNYYTIASALMQDEGRAEAEALEYITLTKNNPRVQMMSFQLLNFTSGKTVFRMP